jgi:hypothetical protein
MHDTRPILVVKIDEVYFPLLVESLSNAEDIADFASKMNPYGGREYTITECRNLPLEVTPEQLMNESDTLERLIEFCLYDERDQKLILEYAAANHADPLTWSRYDDIFGMFYAAEYAYYGR